MIALATNDNYIKIIDTTDGYREVVSYEMPDSIIAMETFREKEKNYLIAMDMSNAFYLLSTDGST